MVKHGIVTYTRLPEDLKGKFDAIAQAEYTTVASLLRRAAIEFIRARELNTTPEKKNGNKTIKAHA